MLAEQKYTSIYNSYVFQKADKNTTVWTAPFAGIKSFQMPPEMKKSKGTIAASGGSEIIPGSGLVTVDVIYLAMSETDYSQLITSLSIYAFYAQSDINALKNYQQLASAYSAASAPLFSVYGIKNNGTAEDLKTMIKDIYVTYAGMDETIANLAVQTQTIYPAGTAGDYSFYIVQTGKQDKESFSSGKNHEFYDDYQDIYNNIPNYVSFFTYQRPIGLTEINLNDGKIIFETKDIDGNNIKSKNLFSGYKVTMLNIWSTTCSVCLTEIPVLQEMNKNYNKEGAQIVGLLYDGDDPAALKEAQEFCSEYDVDYTNIIANDTLKKIFPTQSFPMTYYFDEEGRIIGDPVIGADLKKYEEKLKDYLEKMP